MPVDLISGLQCKWMEAYSKMYPTFLKDVDLSNANRGVWLVKVPKYIADRWEGAKDGADVGKLRIQGLN